MDRIPSLIDEALERMQEETRARGLLHLQSIFGSLFSKENLIKALEMFSLNIEQAALYLQDNLPEIQKFVEIKNPEIQDEVIELNSKEKKEIVACEFKIIPGPTSGKIALEFSLSSQYIDSTVPVFYIVDEILKEIFSFLQPWERGRLASICKTWQKIDSTTGYLYQIDCKNN